MKNKHLIICFGSLKKTGYNFQRFGPGQNFLKNIILDGYEMFSVAGGAYPAVCEGTGKINCEIHSVDQENWDSIFYMETGAGYSAKEIILENDKKATIYVWPRELLVGKYPKIESGNWE